jgi:hypothetical protein
MTTMTHDGYVATIEPTKMRACFMGKLSTPGMC